MSKEPYDIKNQFRDINDPVIIIAEKEITIKPVYANWSLSSSFLPILASLYILFKQDDYLVNMLCYFIIIGTVIFIFTQLSTYNEIVIDLENKSLIIRSNICLRLFKSKKTIKFSEIKRTDAQSDSFWPAFRRYNLVCVLKNDDEIQLINSGQKVSADKLAEIFSSIKHTI